MHPDKRLQVHIEGNCGVLQPAGWQGAHLRRDEQRFRMEQASQIVYGGECSIPIAFRIDFQLLQDHYGKRILEGVRIEEHEPHQGFRVQVHIRICQMDCDGKAKHSKHLHAKQSLREKVSD